MGPVFYHGLNEMWLGMDKCSKPIILCGMWLLIHALYSKSPLTLEHGWVITPYPFAWLYLFIHVVNEMRPKQTRPFMTDDSCKHNYTCNYLSLSFHVVQLTDSNDVRIRNCDNQNFNQWYHRHVVFGVTWVTCWHDMMNTWCCVSVVEKMMNTLSPRDRNPNRS